MINYKLAKEIGATHYRECVDNEVDYYKLSYNGLTLLCYSKKCEEWDESLSTGAVVLAKIKPIPPKPRTSTEYEKVTESIFDLRENLESGELYERHVESIELTSLGKGSGVNYGYSQITSELDLFKLAVNGDAIYRRVEKVADWRKETKSYLKSDNGAFKLYQLEAMLGAIAEYPEQYIEHCRVALRANGELD